MHTMRQVWAGVGEEGFIFPELRKDAPQQRQNVCVCATVDERSISDHVFAVSWRIKVTAFACVFGHLDLSDLIEFRRPRSHEASKLLNVDTFLLWSDGVVLDAVQSPPMRAICWRA